MGWNYLHDISDDGGNWSSDLSLLLAARLVWVGYDVQTGRCLDTSINGNNGTVYTDACNGGDSESQQWYFDVNTIRNTATGQCLDSNSSGNLYTMPCNRRQFPELAVLPSPRRRHHHLRPADETMPGQRYLRQCLYDAVQRRQLPELVG